MNLIIFLIVGIGIGSTFLFQLGRDVYREYIRHANGRREWDPSEACQELEIVKFRDLYIGKIQIRKFEFTNNKLKVSEKIPCYCAYYIDGEPYIDERIEHIAYMIENFPTKYTQDLTEIEQFLYEHRQRRINEAVAILDKRRIENQYKRLGIQSISVLEPKQITTTKQSIINELLDGTETPEELALLERIIQRQNK